MTNSEAPDDDDAEERSCGGHGDEWSSRKHSATKKQKPIDFEGGNEDENVQMMRGCGFLWGRERDRG